MGPVHRRQERVRQGWEAANAYHWLFCRLVKTGQHKWSDGPMHAMSLREIDGLYPIKTKKKKAAGSDPATKYCKRHRHTTEECREAGCDEAQA